MINEETSEKNNVVVKILDRPFKVKCPPDKVSDLHLAAKYLDDKLSEIKGSSKIVNMDILMAIGALNIAHELLLQRKNNNTQIDEMNQMIGDLQQKIELALAEEGT